MNKVTNYFSNLFKNIKNYLITIYTPKLLITKLIIFAVSAFVIFLSSFLIRNYMINSQYGEYSFLKGFLEIRITQNTGISFSGLKNSSPWLVYLVQIIPIIISTIVLVFSKWLYIDIGLSMLLFGGLTNVIDRAIPDNYLHLSHLNVDSMNAVVDYFMFSFIPNSAIFNLPDVFIIVGVITIGIASLVYFIKSNAKEKSKETTKHEQQN